MSESIHRRGLLQWGAGALIAVPLLGCNRDADTGESGESGAETGAAAQKAENEANDVELLNQGILLEQTAISAYQAAAGLPYIASDPAVIEVAKLFMGQHEEHRDTLAKWVQTLGGTPADPKTAPAPEIPAIVSDESVAEDARKVAVLELARKLEKGAADAYFALVTQQLQTDFARRSAAEILPVEAQHVAIYDLVLKRAAPVSAALFSEQT